METIITTPAWAIASEIELSYKSKVKASERPAITGSRDLYKLLLNHWDQDKLELMEQFKVALLNRANKVLGILNLATGTITGTAVDVRLLFAAALKTAAIRIVLCHNHPSGTLQPSPADMRLTEKIKSAGDFLDIEVLDHIIIAQEGFYSFADNGLI